jgi:hypothetical protein
MLPSVPDQPGVGGEVALLWFNLEDACARQRESTPGNREKNFPQHLIFGIGGNAGDHQLFGWNHPEDRFTWTEGREAIIEIPPARSPGDYFLNVRLAPLLSATVPRQRVRVYLGSICVAHWTVVIPGHYFALVPACVLDSPQQLTFYLPDAASPAALGLGTDDRELALQFFEFNLTPWATVSF